LVSGKFWSTTRPLLGAFGQHHNNRQITVHTRESIGKRRVTRLSKDTWDWRRVGGAVSEIRWGFLGLWVGSRDWATSTWLLGGFDHLHNNRQKVTQIRKSIGMRRGTRLSKYSFDWSRDGGTVSDIGGYIFLGFRVFDYNRPALGAFGQHHNKDRKSYAYGRTFGREGEQEYLKILLIGEVMVRL
jgi:hypothetical protein